MAYDYLIRVAELLEVSGFNVVPVTAEKRPLGRWSSNEKLYSAEDVAKMRDRVRAIAITGDYYANSEYAVIILDIDEPDTADAVLSTVFRDWRRELCGGYDAFCGLTGPRPKGKVKCNSDICVNEETGERMRVDEVKRGMYVVLRVLRNCAGNLSTSRFGAIELIFNNMQTVYGDHPSGLRYEFAKWLDDRWVKTDTPGPGVILTCDEFSRLISALRKLRPSNDIQKTQHVATLPQCREYKPLADPQLLLETLKRLWPAKREDGSYFHDEILYAVIGVAWWRCIDHESLKAVLSELFSWAVKEGYDNERKVREHWTQTFNYIYGGKAQKVWGIRYLENVVSNVARAMGLDDGESNDILDDILKAIGIGELHRPVCTTIKYIRTQKNGKFVSMPAVKLCNSKQGIVKVEKKHKDGNVVTTVTKVVNAYISEMTIYRDAELDIDYISAKVEIPQLATEERLSMARISALERILRRRQVVTSPNWQVLIDYYPRQVDYIISGFVCGPEPDRYPCAVRDYFDTGCLTDTTREESRVAIERFTELLSKYAPSGAWYATAITAFFHGAFQNFFFTRKLWGVRPQILAFVGPRGTGKTTIARTLLETFFPRVAHKLFLGAASVLTPARVGRMQDNLVTTLMVIDEVESVSHKQDVYATLKSYISNPTAWRTAMGDEWPARAGLILTANALVVDDPELMDKIYTIHFTDTPQLEKRSEFARELLYALKYMNKFGAYYLKYAETHWQDVKEYILASSASRGAELYAKAIADDLNISIELTEPGDASTVVVTAVDKYIRWMYNYVVRFSGIIRDDAMPAWRVVDEALQKSLLPHHRAVNDHVLIMRTIQSEIMVNIRTLCEELGGKLDRHGCVVERNVVIDKFYES